MKEGRDDVEAEVLDVSEQENYLTALMMQVASTPTFVLGEEPVFIGTVPTLEELNNKIDEYTGKGRQPA